MDDIDSEIKELVKTAYDIGQSDELGEEYGLDTVEEAILSLITKARIEELEEINGYWSTGFAYTAPQIRAVLNAKIGEFKQLEEKQ